MKGNPARPGRPLKSKPTWWNTFGCSATSAFFILLLKDLRQQESSSWVAKQTWRKAESRKLPAY